MINWEYLELFALGSQAGEVALSNSKIEVKWLTSVYLNQTQDILFKFSHFRISEMTNFSQYETDSRPRSC